MINRPKNDPTAQENARLLQLLSLESKNCVQQLQHLEKDTMLPRSSSADPAINRMSTRLIDTANEARSIRDSIISLFGHRSYYEKIREPREGDFALAPEMQADHSRVSRLIEDHIDFASILRATTVYKVQRTCPPLLRMLGPRWTVTVIALSFIFWIMTMTLLLSFQRRYMTSSRMSSHSPQS